MHFISLRHLIMVYFCGLNTGKCDVSTHIKIYDQHVFSSLSTPKLIGSQVFSRCQSLFRVLLHEQDILNLRLMRWLSC